jgi:hypothetical protein
MMHRISAFLVLLMALGSSYSYAQVYGSNSFEFQLGNLPFEDDRSYSTSYNQTNLFYDSGNISLYGRYEQFITPIEERNYFQLTQKSIQFQDDQFRVRAGNFYETLGRGLLLRSYDIPGSVFEESFERTRYAFFRDLEGFAADFTSDLVEVKALRAQPLFNPLPPNTTPDSLRRPDLVEALQANFYLNDRISAGGILMRNQTFGSDYTNYGAFTTDITLTDYVQIFGEYAFELEDALGFESESDAYGVYIGSNFYSGSFGGSVEYKSYNNFRIGSGYNDPPSLIKEHTYPVLNRSTHVLDTGGEHGFQFEVYYNFDEGHALTFNISRAVNNAFLRFEYIEIFLEGLYQFNDQLSVKSFLDYADDELKGEKNRISAGLISDFLFTNGSGVIVDLQYQQFERDEFVLSSGEFEPNSSSNVYSSVSYSFSSDFVVAGVMELSTDPQLTDDPTTFTTVEDETRFWLGTNVLYRANSTNTIELFAGKRRGGPACTSGICYEILDFEGLELRLTTRF